MLMYWRRQKLDVCKPPMIADPSITVVFVIHTCVRQGVIYRLLFVCVCVCVCTVTDFSAEDKASGVKFCTAVHRRPGQGISYFCELSSSISPKSDESSWPARFPIREKRRSWNIALRVDVGPLYGHGRPRRRTYLCICPDNIDFWTKYSLT